jgi:hypothetical protein
MELEVFDSWTIDRRLKQLRKIDENDKILFVDFDSELGDLIFQKKILIDEINDAWTSGEFDGERGKWFIFEQEKKEEIYQLNKVIKKLERELK